jgi:hypothetical protein
MGCSDLTGDSPAQTPILVSHIPITTRNLTNRMLHDLKMRGMTAVRSRAVSSVLALLLICAPFTIGAVRAFPIWDDASVWLLFQEQGVSALVAGHRDRPIMGYLWSLVATSDHAFWAVSFVAQALLWPALGVFSALLWSRYFPALRNYAWVVGCVAVAPFATKVQMVTANIALASFLSVALAYAALLLFLRFIAADDRAGRAALTVGLPMLAAAVLVQEYALSVVMVMLVLFLSTVFFSADGATRRRAFRVICALMLTTLAAYAVYFLLADRGARADVHPFHALKLGTAYFLSLPFRLVTVVWWGIGGGLATSLSEINVISKPGIFAGAYGLLVALLLLYGCSGHRPGNDKLGSSAETRTAFFFAIALIGGLLPMIAMGRVPWDPNDGMSSRFGLPVLPILAALIFFISITLVRSRFWAVAVLVLGFAAGNAAFSDAWFAVRERSMMSALGDALQPYVSSGPGYTVAVIPLPERSLGPRRQWELTARVAANWPSALRQKFWAYRFGGGLPLYSDEEAGRVFGPRGSCRRPQEIDREVRLVVRRGHLDRLLWAEPHSDGSISIEPYCIGEREPSNTATTTESEKTTPGRPFDRRFFG